MGVAAVDLRGLGQGIGETGVEPGAEGLAGRPREHRCGVVVAQGVVGGGQVLASQGAEVLSRGGSGANGKRKTGGRGSE